MDLKTIGVGRRLMLGFGLVLALLAAIVGTALYKMHYVQERMRVVTDINNVRIMLVGRMRDSVSDRMVISRTQMLSTDPSALAQLENRLRELEQIYAQSETALALSLNNPSTMPDELALFAELQLRDRAVLSLAPQIKRRIDENRMSEANALLMNEMVPLQDSWLASMSELVRYEVKRNESAAHEAGEAYRTAFVLLMVLAIIAFAAGIGAAAAVTRSILRQLGGEPTLAMRIASSIAIGDLSVDVPVRADDRNSLMRAMRDMRDQLSSVVGEVRSGAETIASAASQVSAGNLDLSSRTEHQAGALQETASSMEDLTSTVQKNAQHAERARKMAVATSEVALVGGEVVANVAETMDLISASSRKIVDITSVIEGIALQTNILALNAAVEASRAGDKGRGFAVVAGEIRELANRSASAAKAIKVLIDESVGNIALGASLTERAGATMNDIVGQVRGVTAMMGEISSASRDQSTGIRAVSQAITQMDTSTQQNASLVEEVSAAAMSMQDQAANLNALVGKFRLAALGSNFVRCVRTQLIGEMRAKRARCDSFTSEIWK